MDHAQISFDLVGYPLGEDIYSEQGLLLLKKGTILKEIHILLLQKYRFGTKVAIDWEAKKNVYYWKESPSEEPYKAFPSLVKKAFQSILDSVEYDLASFRKKYHELIELALCDLSILKVLQTNLEKEEKFYQHSINVGIFASLIGKILGYGRKECLLLAEMGLFHNIGVLSLARDYGDNANADIESIEQTQAHTEVGYKLLKTIPDLDPAISLAALHHHERLNGSGFPNQRKDGGIPFYAQIVAVADTFNRSRMNHRASGKNTLITGANEIIDATRSNLLNPAIVVPFVQYIMRQTLHEKVKLNNGDEAQILFIHDNEPHQPLIKIEDEYLDLRKNSALRIEGLVGEESAI